MIFPVYCSAVSHFLLLLCVLHWAVRLNIHPSIHFRLLIRTEQGFADALLPILGCWRAPIPDEVCNPYLEDAHITSAVSFWCEGIRPLPDCQDAFTLYYKSVSIASDTVTESRLDFHLSARWCQATGIPHNTTKGDANTYDLSPLSAEQQEKVEARWILMCRPETYRRKELDAMLLASTEHLPCLCEHTVKLSNHPAEENKNHLAPCISFFRCFKTRGEGWSVRDQQ